jgi:hypothetical protein
MSTTTIDTTTRVISIGTYDYRYQPDDFVNADSYDFHHRCWSGRSPRAWVITTYGTVLAIVFEEYYNYTDQDALDEAVDRGKLDSLQIANSDLHEYQVGTDSEGNPEYEGVAFLGNASEPFDQQGLDYFTVPATLFANDPIIAKIIADNPTED